MNKKKSSFYSQPTDIEHRTDDSTCEKLDAEASDRMAHSVVNNPNFTGLARSVECFDNQGFNNFKILTLYIENGKVVKMELSDPWANFECAAILEHVSHLSMIHLNNIWKPGKAFDK